jgi:hypothetical protein
MPAVNGVGEPGAGEPHARFDAAGTGNGAIGPGHGDRGGTAVRETGGAKAPAPTVRERHRASPRPYSNAIRASAPDVIFPALVTHGQGL